MNSGRNKYTSTPTYGMQRRGFGKKQPDKQTNAELDFTQKPTPDFDTQIAGMPDPYAMPQGIYHDPVPSQGPGAYQAPVMPNQGMGGLNGIPVQSAGMPGAYPAYGNGYNDPYGGMAPPLTGTAMPMMPPLANAGQPEAEPMPGNPRAQGYVPPKVMHANQAGQMPPQQGNYAQPAAFTQPNYVQQPYMQQADFNQQGMPYQNQQMPYNQPLYSAQQPANQQPLGAYPNFQSGSQPPAQPPQKPPRQPANIDDWLKMLLYIILPVVFVLCIALSENSFDILRYLFMTASAASIGVAWYRQSFHASLRTGITIGYALMCIVVIVMMSSGGSDVVNAGANITAQPTPVITEEPSAEALGYQPDQAPVATTPAEVLPADTDAGQRLASFMDNWMGNQIEAMLNYVIPSWRQTQNDAAAALFIIIANRTPLSYTIESISGSASDTSRSITMTATIDKNNGNDPVKYRFMILMNNEENDWYVDPNSLSTNDIEDESKATVVPDNLAAIFTLAPRQTVTPVPPDSTILYYNANGGSYYHADPACSAVNSKYFPMASFTYGELNDDPYKKLTPCLVCGAPSRPSD